MNLLSLRSSLKNQFKANGIEVEDVDFIVAECLGVSRTQLSLIELINTKQAKQINKLANQRLKHKPIDMLFKNAYFYGLEFKINKHVLTPRQDSEVVAEQAINLINKNKFNSVLDLCCGSGCLGIVIAKNTNAEVVATDVSAKAIKTAKANAKQNDVSVHFIKSNLFNNIKSKFNLIISNPPYIETSTLTTLDKEVQRYDPKLALDGGCDGLSFYKRIATQGKQYLLDGGYIVLEIGYNQKDAVKNIFKNWTFVDCVKDLGGQDRSMIFRR